MTAFHKGEVLKGIEYQFAALPMRFLPALRFRLGSPSRKEQEGATCRIA